MAYSCFGTLCLCCPASTVQSLDLAFLCGLCGLAREALTCLFTCPDDENDAQAWPLEPQKGLAFIACLR
jgi:hypothetical protein